MFEDTIEQDFKPFKCLEVCKQKNTKGTPAIDFCIEFKPGNFLLRGGCYLAISHLWFIPGFLVSTCSHFQNVGE